MKIVVIHGQNHQGSTCMMARQLAEKVGGETKEFFLPRDFDKPCRGCHRDRPSQHEDGPVKHGTHDHLANLRPAVWRQFQGE